MIQFLTEEHIIAINIYQIQRYSPGEMIGVKDPGALHMCVNSVHATVFGEDAYPSLIEKATVLFINLVKKHCFHNANKRTAYISLELFLKMNGLQLSMSADEVEKLCVGVATDNGMFDALKERVAQMIASHLE